MCSSLGQWLCQGGCGGRTGGWGGGAAWRLPPGAPQSLPMLGVKPPAMVQPRMWPELGRMLFIRGTLNKRVGLWLWGELSQARGPAAWSTVPCANLQTPRCPKINLWACHRAASSNSSQGTDPFLSAVPPQGFQQPGQPLPPCPQAAAPPAMKLGAWDPPTSCSPPPRTPAMPKAVAKGCWPRGMRGKVASPAPAFSDT